MSLTPTQRKQMLAYLRQHKVVVPGRFIRNYCGATPDQLTVEEAREVMRKAKALANSQLYKWLFATEAS